jgi:flagellar biosynthesis GTPase FlhF
MFKFSTGVLTAATIAVAIGSASAQQPSTPAAPASDTGQSAAPAGAYAYIQNLKNGDTVTSPFKVLFGLSANMGVGPAGVEKEKTGHHHLLIDTTLSAEEMTQPIISDEQHKHFGGGQTEAIVTLPPGKHTLQLVLANWTHIPFKPPVQSEVITITVQNEAAAKPVAIAEVKEAAETSESKEVKEAKESKQALEAKQAKEAQAAKEAAQVKPAAETKPATETKPAPEAKAAKEAQETKQAETEQAETAKESKAPKPHKAMHRHHRRHHHHRRLHEEYMHT